MVAILLRNVFCFVFYREKTVNNIWYFVFQISISLHRPKATMCTWKPQATRMKWRRWCRPSCLPLEVTATHAWASGTACWGGASATWLWPCWTQPRTSKSLASGLKLETRAQGGIRQRHRWIRPVASWYDEILLKLSTYILGFKRYFYY